MDAAIRRQNKMGWVMGLEPTTPGTTIRCSNQLSYTHHKRYEIGTPGGTRTPGLLLRRQLLYPPELLAHIERPALGMERAMGIEPTSPAWKAGALAVVLRPQASLTSLMMRLSIGFRPNISNYFRLRAVGAVVGAADEADDAGLVEALDDGAQDGQTQKAHAAEQL